MEDLELRFPYISDLIFSKLDNRSLAKCREVCTSWKDSIDENRLLWSRMIEKYTKVYLDVKTKGEYQKSLKFAPVYIVKDLALAYAQFHRLMPKSIGSTPLHVLAWKGCTESFQYIFEKIDGKKLNLHPEDNSNWTP